MIVNHDIFKRLEILPTHYPHNFQFIGIFRISVRELNHHKLSRGEDLI